MKSVNKLKSLAFKFGCVWTQNPADLASMSVRFRPPAPSKKKGLAILANPFLCSKSLRLGGWEAGRLESSKA
jgi:hypothetical protein